jgi:alanine racemase
VSGAPLVSTTRAWLDVDLGALLANARTIARHAGVPILPMVKADAYGLGAVPVARALDRHAEPWGFGVATVSEGAELRAAGIERRIMVFTTLLPDEFAPARAARLTPTFGDERLVREWKRAGGDAWHLAVDTGMSRSGVRWDQVDALDAVLREAPPEGAYTHYHSAERRDGSRELQEQRFEAALERLPARPRFVHVENSPGVEHCTPPSRYSLVRPGIFLYGVGSGSRAIAPEPVVHLRARIVEMRTIDDGDTVSYLATYRARGTRRIATLATGYGDGYRRALGNRGTALVHGRRVPVVGLVTMDMTMLDVTDVPCEVGDVATLIGRDGDALLDVASVAASADGLSPYELLTGLRQRLPRRYLGLQAGEQA